jgi:uncharacterized protein
MLPSTLKYFNCFVDGVGYAGRVEELELPKLTIKTEEWRGGGMDAPVEIDLGMEKLEATLTFAEYSPPLFALLGLVESAKVGLTLRGSTYSGEAGAQVIPVEVNLRGAFRELDMGSWKAGEKGTFKCAVACRYYKLLIGGSERIEIDVNTMVRRIGGVDQLAGHRAALAL